MLISSAAALAAQDPLGDLDRALAERQRNGLNVAIQQLAKSADQPAIIVTSDLKAPLVSMQARVRRSQDSQIVAVVDFAPIFASAQWLARLPQLAPGDYQADVLVSTENGNFELSQKLPWKAATGIVEWQLKSRLIGSPEIDSTHWLRQAPGWWATALDWMVPDGARQRILDGKPRQRPDYLVARQQCAAGEIQGLAGMLHSLRAVQLDADLVEDFLDCVATLDLRLVAYEVLRAWPDGQLTTHSWSVLLGLLRRDIAHGHAERALQVLTRRAPVQQTARQEAQWRDLVSRVLLVRSESALALTYLREGPHLQAEQALVGDPELQLLFQTMRLNLAVSLMQLGRTDEALNLLDQVGRLTPSSSVVAALRDRANLLLGWQFLNQAQGLTAQAVFNRVDLNGHAAAAALLGRGYALLAPPGTAQLRQQTVQQPVALLNSSATTLAAKFRGGFISCEQYQVAMGDDAVCARPRAFEQFEDIYSEAERQQRALQSWVLASQRGGADLATQEARLHAAAALISIGQHRPAQQILERAVRLLEQRQEVASAQHNKWLQEQVLSAPIDAAEAASRLADATGGTALVAEALAHWLATERTQAVFALRAKAHALQWPELVVQANQLLLTSLNQINDSLSIEQARMETEMRLHLARLYHLGALGG